MVLEGIHSILSGIKIRVIVVLILESHHGG